jgi:hypothetical protein
MSFLRRTTILVSTIAMAMTGVALPVSADTSGPTTPGSDLACVTESSAATAIHAFYTPTSVLADDVAFNNDDPDAEANPLELIRYPDETAVWLDSGVTANGSLVAGFDTTSGDTAGFSFASPSRSDAEVSDSVVRLFCGLFDREPTSFELEYWSNRYWNGLPLVTIAESFTHAREFVARHGVVSDEGLVAVLYRDVLGREPSVAGTERALEKLESGVSHRGQIIVPFTESSEYVQRTATTSPDKPILPYPKDGSGRRIIYSNSGGRVWMIDATGELHKTHQVSGRRGIPAAGRYKVYSMSRYAWAPYDGITMEYMVRFARGEWPYGFHSIPVWPGDDPLQTPAQLGTRRSGGCVRQLWDDAQAVFEWSTIGTRVIAQP